MSMINDIYFINNHYHFTEQIKMFIENWNKNQEKYDKLDCPLYIICNTSVNSHFQCVFICS